MECGDFDGNYGTGTGSGSDTGSDTGTGTVPACESSHTTLDWKPLPQGIDCGPGCRQLTFEEINNVNEWAATHRYVAYTDELNGMMHVIDVDAGCYADVEKEMEGTYPDIKGNRLIFVADYWGSPYRIRLEIVDLLSGAMQNCLEEVQTTYPRIYYEYSALAGEKIAFKWERSNENSDIIYPVYVDLYSIGGERKTIFDIGQTAFRVRADGDYVIWEDGQDIGLPDIWAHKISTGKTWNLTNHPSGQWLPRMDGTRVVWSDLRNGPNPSLDGSLAHQDIYMHDFATGETTGITNANWIHYGPDISGDRIVWTDYRACSDPNNKYDFADTHIWMYDLKTKTEHQITSTPEGEGEPQIDGDRVYYFRQIPTSGLFAVFVQELSALGL
ncbi:MAG: hypothetical protein PHU25_08025 [Deltaproteobacteria bacterium]|nr:hypothetical protein [Deltaproteobacteria bacterium]